MSLSYGQERQLRRIESGLRRSDPHLGGMLGLFTRLYADQGMPAREREPSGRDRSRRPAWLTAVIAAIITGPGTASGATQRAWSPHPPGPR